MKPGDIIQIVNSNPLVNYAIYGSIAKITKKVDGGYICTVLTDGRFKNRSVWIDPLNAKMIYSASVIKEFLK